MFNWLRTLTVELLRTVSSEQEADVGNDGDRSLLQTTRHKPYAIRQVRR